MLDVLLYQPEIPPNTGNIMRLCVNTGARLHLIAPLGFELDDAKLRRAGLDYGDWSDVTVHASLEAAIAALSPPRLLAFTTKADRILPISCSGSPTPCCSDRRPAGYPTRC